MTAYTARFRARSHGSPVREFGIPEWVSESGGEPPLGGVLPTGPGRGATVTRIVDLETAKAFALNLMRNDDLDLLQIIGDDGLVAAELISPANSAGERGD